MIMSLLKNKIIHIFLFVTILWTFIDTVSDLFLSFLHLLVLFSHYLFKLCEHGLDLFVEHLFQTSPKETEIIVFYILTITVSILSYLLIRKIPFWYCSSCECLRQYWLLESAKAKNFWKNQTLILKVKWCMVATTGTLYLYFLVFS